MKNFKKLFSVAAIVAMLGTAVPTTVLGAASYSEELNDAYDYAYANGITTQSSIDNANMYGSLIRSHMAKMIVNYATEVMGKTLDTSKTCEFTDIANQSQELQDYIVKSCQLGLMGQGITEFNPNGVVTRAQFGTVLSRLLYGDAYEGGDPYYVNHLQALKDAGIMTNISNPNMVEVRGYVMLMLMRAAGGTTPEVCTTPENVLSCSLGLDTCPAECVTTPVETKAGSLNVSLNSDTLANNTQVPRAGIIKFASVDFKASSSDVTLKTVTIKKVGLASIPTSTRVRFEKDGLRISGKAAFTSDGLAIISFAPTYVVKAGATETLDLYVDLSTTAGNDFQFASDNFGTTAETVNGSFTTPILRTADYAVASLTVSAASATGTANVTDNGMELGAFKVDNTTYTGSETRDVTFKSITLRQDGNASLSNLDNIILERNGTVVASNPVINGREITFTVGDTIKNATSATYYIKAVVNNVETSSDTYQFELRNTSDINAVEKTTDFRCPITGTPVLYTNTIQGSDISFTRDTNVPLSMNYAAGSDIVLMKGTITTKSAITLEDPTVYLSTAGQTTGMDAMFSTIYLQVGNSIFSYSPSATDTGAEFLGSATVNGTATVKMYAKLKDTAPARTVKFQDLVLSSFRVKEYVSNGYTVATSIGSIAGVSVTSQASTLNVTRNDALGNTAISAGTNGVTVYGVQLSSPQGNGVTVSNFQINVAGNTATGGFLNNAYLTLYVDGAAIQSKTVTSTSVTFDGFSKKITTTTPLNFVVKANFPEAFSSGTFQVTLNSMNAYDTLTSNAVTGYAKPAGAVFTIGTAAGTLAASNNNPLSTLLLSPSTAQKITAFKLSASNDGIRLYDVTLTGSFAGLSNFKITNESGDVIATATTINGTTGVVFSQINNAPVVAKDTSANYYVVADVDSSTNTGPVFLNVLTGGTNIKGSNGTTIAVGGANIAGRSHAIAENTLTLAMAANPNKSLTTSALRFTATAAGKTSVEMTGLTFNNTLAGYTGANHMVVYKDTISPSNIAYSGATAGGSVTLSANNVIDAGSTVTYIVVVEGALVDPAANTTDRSVSLTDVAFGGLAGATYHNIGALPFTSVK